MQVPEDVIRNLYKVVGLKGTCFVSEIPVLYKIQCGSDLNYRELGFPILSNLVEKCSPYIQQTFDAEHSQWLLRLGRRLPRSMMKLRAANAPLTAHDIELATTYIFGGKFKATNLKLPLPSLTCSLCFGLMRQFRVWSRCKHGVCETCYRQLTTDDACRICSDNEEDEVMGIPVVQICQNMLEKFKRLMCKCPFDHSKPQFMTVTQFLAHYGECPLNSEFTNAVVVEQTLYDCSDDGSDDGDKNDEADALTAELDAEIVSHIEECIMTETIQLPKSRRR